MIWFVDEELNKIHTDISTTLTDLSTTLADHSSKFAEQTKVIHGPSILSKGALKVMSWKYI